jgi:hypothetical protein
VVDGVRNVQYADRAARHYATNNSQCESNDRGSDGDCTVTYDFSRLKLQKQQEIIDPIICQPYMKGKGRYSMRKTRLPQEEWTEIAQRHPNGESLRSLGRAYGVSYEAVRQVIRSTVKDVD